MMTPGFADPVLGAQSSFRAVLHALAHPGAICALPHAPAPPAPLNPAAAALALALCDADTPVWHDGGAAVTDWLRFHTGAPPAASHDARFLIATSAPPRLDGLAPGSDEAPQEGATLFIQVEGLAAAPGWRLTGPGIETTAELCVTGLPAGFAGERSALAGLFPRGIDIVLCAGDRIAGLPRTTRIEEPG